MALLDTPVLQWPFKINEAGTAIDYVEQDTPAEVAQRVAVLFSTNPGDLVDEPAFGIPEPIFKEGGITQDELLSAVNKWVPEAALIFTTDELVELVQTIEVEVSTV